jgi:hypothetical protein
MHTALDVYHLNRISVWRYQPHRGYFKGNVLCNLADFLTVALV